MMSKNRFLAMLSNFHLTDNDVADQADRLNKIRPFHQMIRQNFAKYVPERDLSFDEGMCPFKGRVRFRVYNPQKPNKFGIKLFKLCESSSGYIIDFDVYDGHTAACDYVDILSEEPGTYDDFTTVSKIVLGSLTRAGLLNKGHVVYMDNYYSSPELYLELDYFDTYACGTVRKNRKELPKLLPAVKLRQGEGIFRRKGNLLALKYHDKRDIHFLTTAHQAKMVVTDKTNRVTGERILKPKPIVEYIKKMGGVDLSDQITQYYEVLRKTVKWWKKLFFHLFNLAIVNSFILYRKYGADVTKQLHVKFRTSIVNALVAEAPDAPKPKRKGRQPAALVDEERLIGRHFVEDIPPQGRCKTT